MAADALVVAERIDTLYLNLSSADFTYDEDREAYALKSHQAQVIAQQLQSGLEELGYYDGPTQVRDLRDR